MSVDPIIFIEFNDVISSTVVASEMIFPLNRRHFFVPLEGTKRNAKNDDERGSQKKDERVKTSQHYIVPCLNNDRRCCHLMETFHDFNSKQMDE